MNNAKKHVLIPIVFLLISLCGCTAVDDNIPSEATVESHEEELLQYEAKLTKGLAIIGYDGDSVEVLGAGGNVYRVHKDNLIYPNPASENEE